MHLKYSGWLRKWALELELGFKSWILHLQTVTVGKLASSTVRWNKNAISLGLPYFMLQTSDKALWELSLHETPHLSLDWIFLCETVPERCSFPQSAIRSWWVRSFIRLLDGICLNTLPCSRLSSRRSGPTVPVSFTIMFSMPRSWLALNEFEGMDKRRKDFLWRINGDPI